MNRLKEQALQLNIDLTNEQILQFQKYYEMLVEKNKVMNLTAITEIEDVITKHFLDSIALSYVYPSIKNADLNLKILDLGTGAGFPGIPLKIAFPHLNIVLMDSLNKRVKFLQEVIETLDLKKIVAVHGRAEEAARNVIYREKFDLCVSRAVANLSTLSEYCIPFIQVNGNMISYKASEIEEEVAQAKRAFHILGGKLIDIKKIILPNSEIERSFVIIHKNNKTPKAYPRKAGTANKEPIQ